MKTTTSTKNLMIWFIILFVGTFWMPSNGSASSDLDSGLVAYWSFDECSGNVAHDYSGNNNDGIVYGATWVPGICGCGCALEFIGTNIVRFIPSSFDNSVTTGFSIACWVYWYGKNEYGRSGYIFDARHHSWCGFILGISRGGKIWLTVLKSGTDDPRVYSDSTVSEGKWTHIVGVFDHTSQTLRIFMDGKENGTDTTTTPYCHTDLSAAIGNNRWAPGDQEWAPFNGIIDEVCFYDRALSEAEIESLSRMSPAKIEIVPRVWYTFWEDLLPGVESDVLCYIGNLGEGYSVSEIDVNSILLNRTVPISEDSDTLLPSYPGFVGPVLRVGFNKREAFLSLGLGGKGPPPGYRVTVEGCMPARECGFCGFTRIKVKGRETNDPLPVMAKANNRTPVAFELFQNHPNPFNPETKISYDLPKDAYVNLTIHNILGQKVKTLVDEFQQAGHERVHWNGEDNDGNKVSSGIYFYRIQAGEYSQIKKMVLVK